MDFIVRAVYLDCRNEITLQYQMLGKSNDFFSSFISSYMLCFFMLSNFIKLLTEDVTHNQI